MIRTTKLLLTAGLAVFVGLIFSVTSFAATTYMYVDVNGDLRTIEADSAAEAIAEAPARDPNSGVILASEMTGSVAIGGGNGTVVSGDAGNDVAAPGETGFVYVDTQGNLRTVYARTAAEAIIEAEGRDPNSGVIVASNMEV